MPRSNKKKKPHEKNEGSNENLAGNSIDTNQRLHQPYQGYDEKKTSNDLQKDYDVDENNLKERSDEYRDWNRDDKPE